MGIFDWFKRKNSESTEEIIVHEENDGWEELPAYIPASADQHTLVSIVATSIAAGNNPDSKFTVKKVWQRNPEVDLVSVIATSIAAGDFPDRQLKIKKISKKKEA